MVDQLLLLNAVLRVYHSNFLNLHWNSVGEEFNDAHKGISTDYYELCDKYVDSTAEMIARLGKNPYNYKEVCDTVLKNIESGNDDQIEESYSKLLTEDTDVSDNNYIVIDSNKLYTRKDIIMYSNTMLGHILNLIAKCLESEEANDVSNTGIRSDLEAMHSEFDLQFRYINRRRMM